jgi:hypothetical protein
MDGTKYDPRFGPEITFRYPKVRAYVNWILGLAELYTRNPIATYYAMFQDDIICCRGLKEYLEECHYPEPGYWNLICYPQNMDLAGDRKGWIQSNQFGRGAQGLVFDRQTVLDLLTHSDTWEKPQDANRGWRSIDGHVIDTLKKKAGYKEYVHVPSLLDHVGCVQTSMDPPHNQGQPPIQNFVGEDIDIRDYMVGRVGVLM